MTRRTTESVKKWQTVLRLPDRKRNFTVRPAAVPPVLAGTGLPMPGADAPPAAHRPFPPVAVPPGPAASAPPRPAASNGTSLTTASRPPAASAPAVVPPTTLSPSSPTLPRTGVTLAPPPASVTPPPVSTPLSPDSIPRPAAPTPPAVLEPGISESDVSNAMAGMSMHGRRLTGGTRTTTDGQEGCSRHAWYQYPRNTRDKNDNAGKGGSSRQGRKAASKKKMVDLGEVANNITATFDKRQDKQWEEFKLLTREVAQSFRDA
ncbi:unnamed protein product [Closterium sp. Yama58-4]|nr:unnamed protein product [Closterium sp. Yama58-4]